MFVHIWRMRARKKRVDDYEKFGRQVDAALAEENRRLPGRPFIKLFQSRKPEYLWLVFWRDHKALEQARPIRCGASRSSASRPASITSRFHLNSFAKRWSRSARRWQSRSVRPKPAKAKKAARPKN